MAAAPGTRATRRGEPGYRISRHRTPPSTCMPSARPPTIRTAEPKVRGLGGATTRASLRPYALGGAAVGLAVTLAADHGGFFPTAWNWATFVALVGLAAVVAESGAVRLARGQSAMLGLVAALIGWTALSLVWTDSISRGVPELERDLAYLAVLPLLLLLGQRVSLPIVLVATVATVCIWSLVTYAPTQLDLNEGRLLVGWI